MTSEMIPTCPFCGYSFDAVAPEGQVYKCRECRQFFNVGESPKEDSAEEDTFEEKWQAIESQREAPDKTEAAGNESSYKKRVHVDIANRSVSPLSDFYKPVGLLLSVIGFVIAIFLFIVGQAPGSLSGEDWLVLIVVGIVDAALFVCGGVLWTMGKEADALLASKRLTAELRKVRDAAAHDAERKPLEESNEKADAGAPEVVKSTSGSAQRPVVYLRSFLDDDTGAKSTLDPADISYSPDVPPLDILPLKSEEEQMAEVFGEIGPFFALGRPGEPLPELGATRAYVADEEWQDTVLDMMNRARLAVFRAGSTHALDWEIDQAGKLLKPEQVVFLIPWDLNYDKFVETHKEMIPWEFPALPTLPKRKRSCGSLSGVVYFEPDGSSHFVLPQRLFLRASRRKPVAAQLTTMLKPVFEHLGIEWRPPGLGYAFWLVVVPLVAFAVLIAYACLRTEYRDWRQKTETAAIEKRLLGTWQTDDEYRGQQQRFAGLVVKFTSQYNGDGSYRMTSGLGPEIVSKSGCWSIADVSKDRVKIAVILDEEPNKTVVQWRTFLDGDTMVQGSPPQMDKRWVRVKENEP